MGCYITIGMGVGRTWGQRKQPFVESAKHRSYSLKCRKLGALPTKWDITKTSVTALFSPNIVGGIFTENKDAKCSMATHFKETHLLHPAQNCVAQSVHKVAYICENVKSKSSKYHKFKVVPTAKR